VLEQPFLIDDRIIRITAGIGIAAYPADGQDAPTLMRHAEEAMQSARSAGCGYAEYSTQQESCRE
jgi:diguanylate cyclase